MYKESKKIKIIRISLITISLFILVFIITLLYRCSQSIEVINNEMPTEKKEEKIVFELWKAPYKQKNKLRGHVEEYDDQVYHYLFSDEKIINTAKYSGVTDYYHLTENYGNFDAVKDIYASRPLWNLITMIFSDEEIDYSKYAFTDNYIEKHPISLKKEFKDIYKDNYEIKRYYNETLESNIIVSSNYGYDIGIDRVNEMVIITESKNIDFETEDGESYGIRHGKKGSAWEGEELFGDTRKIYFKYTLDEKDYLDDIKLDHIDVLIDDKLLDSMS